MSGGSLGYLCFRLARFYVRGDPVLERLFNALVECLKSLEWWWSCDTGPNSLADAIVAYNRIAKELSCEPGSTRNSSLGRSADATDGLIVLPTAEQDRFFVELIEDIDRLIDTDVSFTDCCACPGDRMLAMNPLPHLTLGCTCREGMRCECAVMREAFDISSLEIHNYMYVIRRRTTFFAKELRQWRLVVVSAIRSAMTENMVYSRLNPLFVNRPLPTDAQYFGAEFVERLKAHEKRCDEVSDVLERMYDEYTEMVSRVIRSMRIGYRRFPPSST